MFRLPKEDRAGIYTTVIVHLAVVIVLLLAGLGTAVRPENSFVLDFSKLEEKERIQQEEERLPAVRRPDQLLRVRIAHPYDTEHTLRSLRVTDLIEKTVLNDIERDTRFPGLQFLRGADPSRLLRAASMLLRHIARYDKADALDAALDSVPHNGCLIFLFDEAVMIFSAI